jgi:uncharacterized membrane protein YwzB
MMSACRLLVTAAVAFLLMCGACTVSAAVATPTLAFFDINRSVILSTTEESEPTSLGLRNFFSSRYDPRPAVSVASLTFSTPSHGSGPNSFEFLTVPYCVDTSGTNAHCDFSDHVLYLLVRFRRHQEVNFETTIWQDASPTTATQNALTAFKARLNRTDVIYPAGDGAMRMEDAATCSDITDECYLSSAATYTRSYKGIDPSQYSGRFLFRLAEKYSLNSAWRVRLQHSLPHDAEAEVEVVLVLNRLPAINPLDSRWWLERIGGRLALLTVATVVAFGFLAFTREVASLLTRRHSSEGAVAAAHPATSALYDDLDSEGFVVLLQRVVKVATGGVQKAADYAAGKMRGWHCHTGCTTQWRRWWDQRRRLPTSDDVSAEADREIAAVATATVPASTTAAAPPTGEEEGEGEEEAGPMCRICRCREPSADLFAPCACNGSSKYVHHHCLEQWREMTTNPEHRRVCAECKTPYTLVRVVVPQNANLLTSSPIIEPAIRHYVTTAILICITVFFAAGGAYGLKAVFCLTTGFDPNVEWSFMQGYHWVLAAYFLLATWLNVLIMQPFVKDMDSAELQLVFVLLSLVFLEIPISYAVSAFFSLFFDRLFTWEISYGLGLGSTFLIQLMDVFSNYSEMLDSFAEEREVVAPRASTEEERPPV